MLAATAPISDSAAPTMAALPRVQAVHGVPSAGVNTG